MLVKSPSAVVVYISTHGTSLIQSSYLDRTNCKMYKRTCKYDLSVVDIIYVL